jgi:cytochrome P450
MTIDDSLIQWPAPRAPQPDHCVSERRLLLGGCPVARAELPDGSTGWLAGDYAEVRQVVVDPRFSRALAVAPGRSQQGWQVFAAASISGMDAPEHTRIRKLVGSAFTARRVEALRPRVASIVSDLIDSLLRQPQPADLVSSFALPLPVQVICEMLGVPAEDMEQFHAWSDTVMSDWDRDSDQVMTAILDSYGYFGKLIAAKRAEPADDLMTALIAARDQDDGLSEEELTTLGSTILISGHETTASNISSSLVLLLGHADQLAALRGDPALIPGAVEEFVRYVQLGSAVPPARMAREDVQLGDVTIRAGEVVLPMFHAANRDPSVFSDPDMFDVTRPPASHLAFGAGPHYCIGAQLARMEMQEAFRGLLRIPGLRLAVPAADLKFKPGMAVYSLTELPVSWDAR